MNDKLEPYQLFNNVCGFAYDHPMHQFMDYRIYDRNHKDITKQMYGIKPDVDKLDMHISHGLCKQCEPEAYKLAGIEDLLE